MPELLELPAEIVADRMRNPAVLLQKPIEPVGQDPQAVGPKRLYPCIPLEVSRDLLEPDVAGACRGSVSE